MSKIIKDIIKVIVPAGEARPAPPLGPILGQKGVNIPECCKEINSQTKDRIPGELTPIVITVYMNKSFSIEVKQATMSHLLRSHANISKGSSNPGKEICGQLTKNNVRNIAEIKRVDMNAFSIDSAMKIVEGSAKSMGLTIVE